MPVQGKEGEKRGADQRSNNRQRSGGAAGWSWSRSQHLVGGHHGTDRGGSEEDCTRNLLHVHGGGADRQKPREKLRAVTDTALEIRKWE